MQVVCIAKYKLYNRKMTLSETHRNLIQQNLNASVKNILHVSGGDINQAAKVTLGNGQVIFIKWHRNPPPNMFFAEAQGLKLLNSANALRVPKVYFCTDNLLAMEWLGRSVRQPSGAAAKLGVGLAQQHRAIADTFGLKTDNYCGLTPQCNAQSDNWVEFFADRRLTYQMLLAASRNRLPTDRRQKLERLIVKLPEFLPAHPPASLLHGDLWGGNWIISASGEAALIDPAVYFGHREADLAFTELFGGFPPEFYRTYQTAWPLEPGYNERKDIYNLYHLLNHLNLFGGGYGGSVDTVLKRYT